MHSGVQVSSQHGSWIPDWPLLASYQHWQSQASAICKPWSTAGFTDQDDNLRKPCFWTCRSIYLERSAEHSQMQFTLFTYFHTSSKTFLFLALLAHRARSRLLELTRYITYLLTYLLCMCCDRWELGVSSTVSTVKLARVESTCSECRCIPVYSRWSWASSVMYCSVLYYRLHSRNLPTTCYNSCMHYIAIFRAGVNDYVIFSENCVKIFWIRVCRNLRILCIFLKQTATIMQISSFA